MRRAVAALACTIAGTTTVLAAGCAGLGAPGASGGAANDVVYTCWGQPVPASALDEQRSAETLGDDGRAALDGMEVPAVDPADWWVVTETPERLALVRELDAVDDRGAGDVRTHEMLTVDNLEAAAVDPVEDWMLDSYGSCALHRDVGGDVAIVTLDPDRPPDPTSRELNLLVTEMACNSGQDAAGRVRVAEQRETTTAVHLAVVVDPHGGAHDCQSNPATPYAVELDEALGERVVLDVGVAPPRELRMPDAAAP
ncbi:hypothetical protein [Isoptericola haloaureus]|uniref:Secreted protein n=1 Tax=Isoptericola haloaureus TaxID=1542902 RepID=A0ABU7Z3D9_9MICO